DAVTILCIRVPLDGLPELLAAVLRVLHSVPPAPVLYTLSLHDALPIFEVLYELAQDEGDAGSLAEAEQELRQLAKDVAGLEIRTLLDGPYDDRNAVVTIRAEAGGVDAADWAEMLMRMYLRWSERHSYPTEVYDVSYAEEAGIKSATFKVSAPYVYGTLSVEQGTHRLVRISPFDNQ